MQLDENMWKRHGELTVNEILFFTAWILFSSTLILMVAIFYVDNEYLELLCKLVRYGAYLICVIKIIRTRYTPRGILFLIILSAAFALSGAGTGNLTYPLYAFIVLASVGIDNDKTVRLTAWIQGLYLGGIVLLSQMGLILDYVFDPDTRSRHGLGFSWTTTPPILFFYFTLCVLYNHRKKISLRMLCVLELINIWLLHMTDSKMAFLMCTFCIVFAGLERLNPRSWKWLSKLNGLYIAFPFLMLAVTMLAVKIYNRNVPAWASLNELLSGRLTLSQDAFRNYGFKLLGQPISWVGYDYKALFVKAAGPYNYVDSSYLQLAFNNGLIFLFAVLVLYSYGIYKAIKRSNYPLVMIYVAVLLFALTEPRLMNFAFNPFPLLALGEIAQSFVKGRSPGRTRGRNGTIPYSRSGAENGEAAV